MDYATVRFAENGFHPTSVAEITEGLGVGKGVFYWYFESKDDLLRAILSDAQRDLRRRQRAAIANATTPSERIERGHPFVHRVVDRAPQLLPPHPVRRHRRPLQRWPPQGRAGRGQGRGQAGRARPSKPAR